MCWSYLSCKLLASTSMSTLLRPDTDGVSTGESSHDSTPDSTPTNTPPAPVCRGDPAAA